MKDEILIPKEWKEKKKQFKEIWKRRPKTKLFCHHRMIDTEDYTTYTSALVKYPCGIVREYYEIGGLAVKLGFGELIPKKCVKCCGITTYYYSCSGGEV